MNGSIGIQTYTTIGFANGPGGPRETVKLPMLTMEEATGPEFIQRSLPPMPSEAHGGEELGNYAIGPWSHLFRGTVEENCTFHVMDCASRISERAAAKAPAQERPRPFSPLCSGWTAE